jgi:SpoIID/LytB domain protein
LDHLKQPNQQGRRELSGAAMNGRRAVAAAAVLTTVAGSLTSAVVQAPEAVAVQQAAMKTIQGRGFGHGRGMSQYGAQGAAIAGKSAKQILDFYYPGTAVGRATGSIRIRINADSSDGVRVAVADNLRVRDISAGKVWTLPRSASMSQWSLDPYGEHGTQLKSFDAKKRTWTVWSYFKGMGQFEGPAVIALIVPSGSQTGYRGSLRTLDVAGPHFDTINVLPLETYLLGVVPRESPSGWRPAALQAQAVAARTYAAYHRRWAGSRGYDLCDTTACQVYGGWGSEVSSTNSAIRTTAGQIRLYRNTPIMAEFSSSNGGATVASGMPYQVTKADGWDAYPGNRNANADWTVTRSTAAVQAAFGVGALRTLKVLSRTGVGPGGGRVLRIEAVGVSGRKVLTGDQLRSKLKLRSNWFYIK